MSIKSGQYHMVRVAPESSCADVYTYHSSAVLWMALMVLTTLVVGFVVELGEHNDSWSEL